MNVQSEALTVLISISAIAGLWVYLVKVIPSLVIEDFRNEVFDLRNRFFNEALNETIPFNHPAYGFFRSLLNGHIRFAHKMSFAQVAIIRSVYDEDSSSSREFEERWKYVLEESSDEQKELLVRYSEELSRLIVTRLVLGSWLLVILIVPVVLLLVFKKLIAERAERYLEPFNSVALEEGESAARA